MKYKNITMTPEEKSLLLQDLCARIRCKVMCSIYRIDDCGVGWRDETLMGYFNNGISYEFYFEETPISIDDISKIKPYLRPMESMTEEERNEYFDFRNQELQRVAFAEIGRESAIAEISDWLDKKMFDYRGLIPMGLALPAKEGMYKI